MVMGSQTSQKRFDACRRMLDWGFATFALYRPESPTGAAVSVKLGTVPTVSAVLETAQPLLVEKGQLSRITARAELAEALEAPVARGDRLGELIVECDGRELARLPLTAGEDVPKLGWANLFARLLGRIAMGSQNS